MLFLSLLLRGPERFPSLGLYNLEHSLLILYRLLHKPCLWELLCVILTHEFLSVDIVLFPDVRQLCVSDYELEGIFIVLPLHLLNPLLELKLLHSLEEAFEFVFIIKNVTDVKFNVCAMLLELFWNTSLRFLIDSLWDHYLLVLYHIIILSTMATTLLYCRCWCGTYCFRLLYWPHIMLLNLQF